MNAVAEQTGLIRQPHGQNGNGALSVYDRVDPFKFIDDMGRVFGMTGAGGADTLEKGKLLALACLSRRMDIFQLSGTYHLIGGKLSMKSDVMLAKFRQAGGKHRWIKDGSDGQMASAELTFEGQSHVVSYSIDDAKKAGLLAEPGKKPGNWEKNPGPMLRARVVSSGVRMVAPEVLEGSYCPEELSDEPEVNGGPVQATVIQSAALIAGVDPGAAEAASGSKRKRRTAAEIAADNAAAAGGNQPQGNGQQATTATATATTDEVIDAVAEPVANQPQGAATATTESTATATTATTTTTGSAKEPVFNADLPGTSLPVTLAKIDGLAGRFGTDRKGLETILKNGNPAFTTIDALSENDALSLVANLEARLAQTGK